MYFLKKCPNKVLLEQNYFFLAFEKLLQLLLSRCTYFLQKF